jgi:DNA-binding transcriptional ArsR family regulator
VTAVAVAEVFAALGDPNRQRILELLAARGRASATALAAPISVTRQAADKHLRVLERAGLVSASRAGREVLYAVRGEELVRSAAWLQDVAAQWDRRLATIKAAAEAPDTGTVARSP